ncbi:hypothetical protein FB567DRAFT_140174 [Paraphoma chrysanthemicola]|uniref:Rhodopsin domain-containing protein n=1 Tax=Paraphoma chrysanthemicola TaxID=798071 RepID=A0A8K0VVT3_9PLEO|nr:hypothetical protein FB567DRAFT_140174 [Paraphoma chrysanthemicola]
MPSNRQSELVAATIATYAIAAFALALRMYARKKMKTALVWEDFLAVLAFAFGSGFTFVSLAKLRWGLGLHQLELWIDMWLYTFSVGLSKFVILGFYWRTFEHSSIRPVIQILFACSALWIITRVGLILAQCHPIEKFWHQDLPGSCPITPMLSLFAASIPHLILELAILICPLFEIYTLHLPRNKKLGVAVMFTSGLLVCISALATIVHTIILEQKKDDPDLTWNALNDQIWAVCDVNLASFATSLPLLRPIFRSFGNVITGLKSSISSPRLSTSGTTHSTNTFASTPSARSARSFSNSDSALEYALAGGYLADDVLVETYTLDEITRTTEFV